MILSREAIQKFLAEESLLGAASPATLERLSEIGFQTAVPAGKTAFRMGQPSDALHFIASGSASLVKVAEDGRQRILHRVSRGDMVGAVPFFDEGPYPASLVAETDLVLFSLPREPLLRLFAQDPALPLSIIGGVVERLRLMVSLVEQITFEDTAHRLWDYLVANSSAPDGTGDAGFPRVLESLPTREHIASSIGTVREVVSRRLSQLTASGHVRIEGRRLTLVKPLG